MRRREGSAMPQTKRASEGKRPSKTASVLGIAGVSLAASAGGSAAALPSQFMGSFHPVTLFDEEISDVSLATFHIFDAQNLGTPRLSVQLAHGGCGCGHGGCGHGGCGHGGCGHGCGRGCGGCHRGCGGWHRGCGGCGCGFGGCGCAGGGGCCLSWGGCWPTC